MQYHGTLNKKFTRTSKKSGSDHQCSLYSNLADQVEIDKTSVQKIKYLENSCALAMPHGLHLNTSESKYKK